MESNISRDSDAYKVEKSNCRSAISIRKNHESEKSIVSRQYLFLNFALERKVYHRLK